jgi:hypothetical protein
MKSYLPEKSRSNIIFVLCINILTFLSACSKHSEDKPDSFVLTGIKSSKGSDLVTIKLDSGVVNSTPINCYVLGSTVFDSNTNGYGYVDCDSVFQLINPVTGNLIKSFNLPGYLSQIVIDNNDNTLIGRYTIMTYGEDPDTLETKSSMAGPPVYTNYVIRVDLETGSVLSKNQVDIGDGVFACAYFYDQTEKRYFLLRADNNLISINPATGEITKTSYIGKSLNNVIYNQENNTITGITYSSESGKNYIETYDLKTGSQINIKELNQFEYYKACISGFDQDLNCYIMVTSAMEVLFIDISTGETIKSTKLEVPLNDLKFWKK